jgi:hypothetical protein
MTTMNEPAGATPGFTAHEAARTLNDLETYEDTVNARAGALAWMGFGLGAAGIFVTYGAGTHALLEAGLGWLLPLLWVPWILGAAIMMNGIFKLVAVTTQTTHNTKESWGATLLGTLGFFAIAALLWGITRLADLPIVLTGPVTGILVVGVFTASLATYQSKRFDAPPIRHAFLPAALGIFLVGAVLAVRPLDESIAGLIGAGVTLLGYFAAALYVYQRG